MIFLAVLLALLAEHSLSRWRDDPDSGFFGALELRLEALPTTVAFCVPPLAAGVVYLLMLMVHLPLAQLLVAAAILYGCLGPRDLALNIDRLATDRARGDGDEMAHEVAEPESDRATDDAHRSLLARLFIQSHERQFGPLLWFIAFGPAGAVLYRLTARLAAHDRLRAQPTDPIQSLHAILAWPSARLTALLFALAGSADDALQAWRKLGEAYVADWKRHTWTLLGDIAVASLQYDTPTGPVVPASFDACLAEVRRMQNRALLLLLGAFALFAGGLLLA